MTERELFEQYLRRKYESSNMDIWLKERPDGEYLLEAFRDAWDAWQARAAFQNPTINIDGVPVSLNDPDPTHVVVIQMAGGKLWIPIDSEIVKLMLNELERAFADIPPENRSAIDAVQWTPEELAVLQKESGR